MGQERICGVRDIIQSGLGRRGEEIFTTLDDLRTRDPERLNVLLSAIATELLALSRQRSGRSSEMLERLARSFSAAGAGDISALLPPRKSA
jgi:hypothetical protein